MNEQPAKKILFILRNAPYGSARAQEGIEAILAASVFEQDVSVLFMDEGVWQLHNHQQSRGVQRELPDAIIERRNIERRNIAAQLESFPLYDINNIFVDKKALKNFSIPKNELILEPELVNDKGIRQLISSHDVVITY